jgi:hypothetical protein
MPDGSAMVVDWVQFDADDLGIPWVPADNTAGCLVGSRRIRWGQE